jgi:hypothetical protein
MLLFMLCNTYSASRRCESLSLHRCTGKHGCEPVCVVKLSPANRPQVWYVGWSSALSLRTAPHLSTLCFSDPFSQVPSSRGAMRDPFRGFLPAISRSNFASRESCPGCAGGRISEGRQQAARPTTRETTTLGKSPASRRGRRRVCILRRTYKRLHVAVENCLA